MIKKLVYKYLRHRHFWRFAGFDELSELYVGMMFRGMALSLSGLFVPLYLIGLNYTLPELFMVVAWYFTFRFAIFDWLAGYVVAKFGPKHGLLTSHFILIGSTALFLTTSEHAWPLWLLGGLWGAAQSYFFVSFHVDFSKVKHSEHGGKELSYVTIMEKIGAVIGPLVGGFIATVFGPEYIFMASVVLLVGGLIPLFRTAEPVRINQHIDFKGFKIDGRWRDYVSYAGVGVENNLSIYLWPVFLGLFVLVGSTAYAKLGILASVSFLASVLAAQTIGRIIDHDKGRRLLRYSTVVNSIIHLCRPFASTYPVAFGLNILNDLVTPAYRMPFLKGMFDAADDLPGHRIVYLASMEMFGSLVKGTICWLLVILAYHLEPRLVMTIGFVIAAAVSILIMTENFKALKPRNIINP
jgi:MFS family permease